MKPKYVWCGVTPKGRVMVDTVSETQELAWFGVKFSQSLSSRMGKDEAIEAGYTVKKFRLEEVG